MLDFEVITSQNGKQPSLASLPLYSFFYFLVFPLTKNKNPKAKAKYPKIQNLVSISVKERVYFFPLTAWFGPAQIFIKCMEKITPSHIQPTYPTDTLPHHQLDLILLSW